MGMTVAAAGHHKSLTAIVHHLGLAIFNIGFGTRLVTYIDVFSVLYGKCFYHLIAFGSENLAIDHKVGDGLF